MVPPSITCNLLQRSKTFDFQRSRVHTLVGHNKSVLVTVKRGEPYEPCRRLYFRVPWRGINVAVARRGTALQMSKTRLVVRCRTCLLSPKWLIHICVCQNYFFLVLNIHALYCMNNCKSCLQLRLWMNTFVLYCPPLYMCVTHVWCGCKHCVYVLTHSNNSFRFYMETR